MVYLLLFLTLPLFSSNDGGTPPTPEASHQITQVMRNASRRETPPPPYLHLPVFVESRMPLVEKEQFSPARGTGKEPLPEPVRKILLPVLPSTSQPSASGVSVKTSCKLKKILVQVQRSILGTGAPLSRVTLGTCRASKSTADYIYFEYDFDLCGTKRKISNNQVIYTNTLRYDPPRLQGPIRRAVPFTIPVLCFYNRYQYSYKIGYTPKIQMRTIFKPMKMGAKYNLTPRNAQWERLSQSDQYVLGKPMYFEAEAPSMSQDQRLYLHLCYATPKKSPTSTPQFPVVKNFGCMVESKDSLSRFVPYKTNAVRFSVDAFLFKGMTGQHLYMHCSMFVGSSTPTPAAKSCNYDARAKRWVELYGADSVCSCCDSDCSSAESSVTKIISSRPWSIEPKVKPAPAPKRKTVFTTTKTRTTPTAPQSTRKGTEWRTETAATPMGKEESVVKELERPFGGGGATWVEVEGEEQQQVKGYAVVEEVEVEEEEEQQQVKGYAAVVEEEEEEQQQQVKGYAVVEEEEQEQEKGYAVVEEEVEEQQQQVKGYAVVEEEEQEQEKGYAVVEEEVEEEQQQVKGYAVVEEEQQQVKGYAVVEVEEEEQQQEEVTEPRTTFEEIFDFDK